MKLVKRITPETAGPEECRYSARCEDCTWVGAVRVKYPDSLEEIAGRHARVAGHSVVIEEEAQSE